MTALAKVVDISSWTQHEPVRLPSDNNEDIVLFRKIAVDRRTSQ